MGSAKDELRAPGERFSARTHNPESFFIADKIRQGFTTVSGLLQQAPVRHEVRRKDLFAGQDGWRSPPDVTEAEAYP
jgi:hypothetical protein